MSEINPINVLIVDRSQPDIARITRTLRDAGHPIEARDSDQEQEIYNAIEYQPVDILIVRQGEGLPHITNIQQHTLISAKDIPILAAIDDPATQPPAALLKAGADEVFYLNDPDYLLSVFDKELRQLQIRRDAKSLAVRLNEMQTRYDELLETSRDAIAHGHEGVHTYANPAYARLFGYEHRDQLKGVLLEEIIAPADRDAFKRLQRTMRREGKPTGQTEIHCMKRDGQIFKVKLECAPTTIDEEPYIQIIILNPEQQRTFDQKIEVLSNRDSLTNLYNRKYLTEHLTARLDSNTHAGGAVFYILLTKYRAVSESLGLEGVDKLTCDLATKIAGAFPEDSVVARFSDAVFAAYVPNIAELKAKALGQRISDLIKAHESYAAQKIITTDSAIGICLVQIGHKNALQMLSHADRACDNARKRGANQVEVYKLPMEEMDQIAREEQMFQHLREAIKNQRMELLYQPIASLQGDGVERYKTYLRLKDENQKVLNLETYGAVAERRGLMKVLDQWVIKRSLETAASRMGARRNKNITLFIRLSHTSVCEEKFYEFIDECLEKKGLPGRMLAFEITEQTAEQFLNETKKLREHLQHMECAVALTHFGGKPNSERLLDHIKPDYIKLDTSFIEQLAKDKSGASREAITALTNRAQEMQILVIATEVSKASQMASLWQFGVTLVQGDMLQPISPEMDFDFSQFAG